MRGIVTLRVDLPPLGVPMRCWPEGTSFALTPPPPTNHDPFCSLTLLYFILSCTEMQLSCTEMQCNALTQMQFMLSKQLNYVDAAAVSAAVPSQQQVLWPILSQSSAILSLQCKYFTQFYLSSAMPPCLCS